MKIDSIIVIVKDEYGNYHQGVMDESKKIILSQLIDVYPDNAFTKDVIEDIKQLGSNIREAEEGNKNREPKGSLSKQGFM